MTLARLAVRALDRPGTRGLLARIARLRTGVNVEYDGRWMRILPDGLVVADLRRFPYYLDTLVGTEREVAAVEAAARDLWFFDYRPSRDHIVVDVGAGSGIETRVLAESVGHLYAIEAHPETFARLAATVRRNQWSNVTPIFAAVTDGHGTVYIEDHCKALRNSITDSGIPVPGRTLDAICSEYGIRRVDFLKMNIEGAERLAINGMAGMITGVRLACIACHDFRVTTTGNDFFATRALVTDWLRERGFATNTRWDHPRRFARDYVYARR